MNGLFPHTRDSVLTGVRSDDAGIRSLALDALTRIYWKPAYKYLRVKWRLSPEDAEDVTQDFFARALERDVFGDYDASKARFRTFLRVCLDRLVSNRHRAAGRLKRGGGARLVSLDFEGAEGELRLADPASAAADPDDLFYREWVRSLFGLAVDRLRRECGEAGKHAQLAVFERYDLADDGERPTYAELATEIGVPATQVTNYLAFARRELRRIVLDELRRACATPEEFAAEARDLLGVDPR